MSDFTDLIEEFLAWQSGVRGLSEHSVAAYRSDLYAMAAMLKANVPPAANLNPSANSKPQVKVKPQANAQLQAKNPAYDAVTTEDLRACIGALSRQNKAAASINRFIASVRNFFAYCRRFDYIKIDPACDLKTVKNPVRVPKFMSAEEVDALCAQPGQTPLLWPERDTALFEMLYSSGCRVSELAQLKLGDVSAAYDSALVRGKGGKDRRVFFSKEASAALKRYVAERGKTIGKAGAKAGGKTTEALFINRKGGALSARGMRFIVSRYSSAEGTNRHVSPHVFRHTFATAMLRSGADIRAVQEMLGHSSISTTQRYTHVTTEELTALYNRAHPHGSENK